MILSKGTKEFEGRPLVEGIKEKHGLFNSASLEYICPVCGEPAKAFAILAFESNFFAGTCHIKTSYPNFAHAAEGAEDYYDKPYYYDSGGDTNGANHFIEILRPIDRVAKKYDGRNKS